MTVLHIIDSGGVYGAEVMLLNLIEEQLELGVRPILGSIGRKGQGEKAVEREAEALGIQVVRFTAFNGPDFRAAMTIVNYAKEHDVDLVHTHGYKGNILLGFIPKRVRSIPMIRTLHGWTNTKTFSKGHAYQILDVLSLKFTESVVAVSRGMLDKAPLRGDNNRNVQVIDNGIKAPDWKALDGDADEVTRFCDGGEFVIGAIGRLSPEKGHEHVIRAVGILARHEIAARLVVIGEGPQRASLEALAAELGLRDSVLFAGYKVDAKRYVNRLDIFALPSLTEGLPITVLEAMYADVAIVSTAVGGVPEVLQGGKAGLLVEPANPEALADAFRKLHDDAALRKSLSDEAGRIAAARYSSRAMASSYLEAYKKAVQG